MNYKFYLDPGTNDPHIWRHNLTESEAIEAVEHQAEIKKSRKNSYVVIGRTQAGRILKIIIVTKHDHMLIVTGYELDGNELKAFRRRGKK